MVVDVCALVALIMDVYQLEAANVLVYLRSKLSGQLGDCRDIVHLEIRHRTLWLRTFE